MSPEEEVRLEKRVQAFIDKATQTANEISTRAVGRVIEERDKSARLLEVTKNEVRATAEKISENNRNIASCTREVGELKSEMRGLQDDIAYLRSQVGGLSSDAEEANAVIGKVVTLKSGGGVPMTAARLDEDGLIQCVWMVDGCPDFHEHSIPLAALQLVKTTAATKRATK